MSVISDNIQDIRKHIPSHVKLVCVSKFHTNDSILQAYEFGERIFGESKVQELVKKQEELPGDIIWHFIGHLQTNKVKYIVPFVELIHGVDSWRLLTEINKQAVKAGRKVNCLLQVHIAKEETKFGFSEDELVAALNGWNAEDYPGISICGLMGMATFTDDQEQVRNEFRYLKSVFERLKNEFFPCDSAFCELSMGMSDDYRIAIEEGSTMVRIGTTIFGPREY